MAKTESPRIAVIGGGPIGLEAILYASTLNLTATLYERGRVGEYLHRWGHIRLFSPFGTNATSLGRAAILAGKPDHKFPADGDYTTGREHLAAYLEPLAQAKPVQDRLKGGTEVQMVGRRNFLKEEAPGDGRRGQQPFRLLVREGHNPERWEEADVVLDCTGTYGLHRWMGDGGIPALGETAAEGQIAYGLEDVLGERRQSYAGKSVLVVGGGYTAATTVCNLVTLAEKHPDAWITWLARGSSTQPINRFPGDPLRERDRLAVRANMLATRGEGNVEFHPGATVDAVVSHGQDRGFRVTGRCGGKDRTWDVERVIANVGYSPDTRLYGELQIHECYATRAPMNLAAALLKTPGGDCLKVTAQGPATLRNPEPNFYILGSKSFGRNSSFLLRAGFEQVRDVFTLITGKPGLDLYKKR